ncbi:hypothetical protein SAY86_028163 [Trapa natans]|uniref:Uncharacterized protein n=1 Tax=Trapa natans TaxID=22666 RepID=A0AAN7M0J6_TRANT|nr:hypothetical protein SAY86_028163 [Trapa natans]
MGLGTGEGCQLDTAFQCRLGNGPGIIIAHYYLLSGKYGHFNDFLDSRVHGHSVKVKAVNPHISFGYIFLKNLASHWTEVFFFWDDGIHQHNIISLLIKLISSIISR